jgi:hypothetical protein
MKVKDVYNIISLLKEEKIMKQLLIETAPYHFHHRDHLNTIKIMNKEIDILQQMIYNIDIEKACEGVMDESISNLLEKYKQFIKP